ncbi:hypothetical protein FSP39_023788 [Pinctada imbricata]|uniref:Endothelin-converting enzyme 1 n=1 Tax=Pinctada imbricata TaxID=66713 RepID=A0AA88YI94_PINIB|nr:hypothetical protein FSP39_023788 [Pinctada imbricata]
MSNQGYKRTNFEDDEVSCSSGGTPGLDFNAGVVFKGGISAWSRRSLLERGLFICVVLLSLVVIILAVILASKTSPKKGKENSTAVIVEKPLSVCLTPACVSVASSIYNAMNMRADPCEDFYEYACGGWIKSHPIPSGHSRLGTFSELWQENQIIMKQVIEQKLNNSVSLAERKAQLYYNSCMDKNKTIEKLKAEPLNDLLKNFGSWPKSNGTDNLDLQSLVEKTQGYGIDIFFSLWVGEDDRNSSVNILQIDQAGLGLPERDFYLNKSITEDKILSAYLEYMKTVGELLGANKDDIEPLMIDIIEFEADLANITVPKEERRDEEKIYHKMTVNDLQKLYPVIDWLKFIRSLMSVTNIVINGTESIVSYSPEFLAKMSDLVTDMLQTEKGKRTLYNYILWHVVSAMTPYLSKPFRNARKVLTEALSGTTGGEELWRYCITDTDGVLGLALGAMFVREAFNGDSKIKASEMIKKIKHAFKSNLPHLDWMDAETRKAAIEKADAVVDMIGFPSYIQNVTRLNEEYQGLVIKEDDYFGNNVRNLLDNIKKNLQKLRKPPKKNVWGMTPPTVNAYYTPSKNQIVFPAGILQAPFYDTQYPKSLNFGAMGVVMGHELTHGFDDQGREYDKNGNLRPWWNNQSVVKFQKRSECMIQQYSSYKLGDDNVRGKQTLGENIADNGGLKSAFHAYEDWLQKNGEEAPLPALNLTHKQLFFLGFAQVWCSSSTKEEDHLQILTDPHSPAQFRVIGTLSNSNEFAEQYKCAKNTRMNPANKCEVW